MFMTFVVLPSIVTITSTIAATRIILAITLDCPFIHVPLFAPLTLLNLPLEFGEVLMQEVQQLPFELATLLSLGERPRPLRDVIDFDAPLQFVQATIELLVLSRTLRL